MSQEKIEFSYVVGKKDQKDHIKNVEKSMTDHKNFNDGEVKKLQDYRSTFPSFRKIHTAVQGEINTRRTSFTQGRKGIDDLVGSYQSAKGDLESEKDHHHKEVSELGERLTEERKNLKESQEKGKLELKQQDDEFKSSEVEKNSTIQELMDKVTRLRKQLKDE